MQMIIETYHEWFPRGKKFPERKRLHLVGRQSYPNMGGHKSRRSWRRAMRRIGHTLSDCGLVAWSNTGTYYGIRSYMVVYLTANKLICSEIST